MIWISILNTKGSEFSLIFYICTFHPAEYKCQMSNEWYANYIFVLCVFKIVFVLPVWQHLYKHVALFLPELKVNIFGPLLDNNKKFGCLMTKPKFTPVFSFFKQIQLWWNMSGLNILLQLYAHRSLFMFIVSFWLFYKGTHVPDRQRWRYGDKVVVLVTKVSHHLNRVSIKWNFR